MKKAMRMMCLVLATVMLVTGCAQTTTQATTHAGGTTEATTQNVEKPKYKVSIAAQATSGQVFQYMADKYDFLAEEGIEVEMVYINNGTDAFSALSSGQVDIMSTYGTGSPLIPIA